MAAPTIAVPPFAKQSEVTHSQVSMRVSFVSALMWHAESQVQLLCQSFIAFSDMSLEAMLMTSDVVDAAAVVFLVRGQLANRGLTACKTKPSKDTAHGAFVFVSICSASRTTGNNQNRLRQETRKQQECRFTPSSAQALATNSSKTPEIRENPKKSAANTRTCRKQQKQ